MTTFHIIENDLATNERLRELLNKAYELGWHEGATSAIDNWLMQKPKSEEYEDFRDDQLDSLLKDVTL